MTESIRGVMIKCLACAHEWNTNDEGIYCPKDCGTVGVNIKDEDFDIVLQLFLTFHYKE